MKKSYRANYTGISMPKELMDKVENFIEEHPEWEYRSRAEYVKVAIREKLQYDKSMDDMHDEKENDIEKRVMHLEKAIDEFKAERGERNE